MALTKRDRTLLGVIVVAMANEAAPFHMAKEAELKGLLKAKMVETNAEITNGEGAEKTIATRATEAGLAENAKTPAAPAVNPANVVPIVKADALKLDLSAFTKRARSTATYDFDNMGVGDSFFINATETRPNPAKSLASTVSAATKKFTGVEGQPDRVFVIAPFDKGESKGGYTAAEAGALVVRTV
jgi:hypothetical protein